MTKPPAKIRSEIWNIKPNLNQAVWLRNTTDEFRDYVRPLVLIVYWNWRIISLLPSGENVTAVEKLYHRTKLNPEPKYAFYFDKAVENHPSFRKFPSYLKKAAIAEAIGIVSSFNTRWNSWKNYDRTKKTNKPPKLTTNCAVYPYMYKGQQLKWGDKFLTVDLKVWNGSDWVWTGDIRVTSYGKGRHLLDNYKIKSASLITNKRGIHLSVPFQFKNKYSEEIYRVVGIDIGINNTATASVVDIDGTVIARRFIHLGKDIDRRDRRRMMIKRKSKKTIFAMRSQGIVDPKLPKSFCSRLYRKSKHINKHIAEKVSTELVKFALEFDCQVIVFEDLKNWKAKAGRRGSLTKQKFHSWCKDQIVKLSKNKAQENSIRVITINAKYTSKYAFDGSGMVKRNPKNYALATFKTGKKYDCDLSASYNIAARYWYSVIMGDKFFTRVYQAEVPDISQRIPVTLSSLWDLSSKQADLTTENQCV